MRIVSKFSDYYDSVMGYGQDLTTTFVRKAEEVPKDSPLVNVLSSRDQFNRVGHMASRHPVPVEKCKLPYKWMSAHTFRVYFCGKTYRGVRVCFDEKKDFFAPSYKDHYAYDFEDLSQFLQTHGLLVKDICRGYFSREHEALKNLQFFLEKQGTDELMEQLIKHRVVIARYTDSRWNADGRYWAEHWETNGSLAEVKFFKVVDPYTAFQELDMYLSGVLGQQAREVVNISDKDRIHQRGFDDYSFRKLPQEKKRSRTT